PSAGFRSSAFQHRGMDPAPRPFQQVPILDEWAWLGARRKVLLETLKSLASRHKGNATVSKPLAPGMAEGRLRSRFQPAGEIKMRERFYREACPASEATSMALMQA